MTITLTDRASVIRRALIEKTLHKCEQTTVAPATPIPPTYMINREYKSKNTTILQENHVPILDKNSTQTFEEQELINWLQQLQPEHLPEEPFELSPGVMVRNRNGFLANLKKEITLGPKTFRARTGVLQEDLLNLKKLVSCNATNRQTNKH